MIYLLGGRGYVGQAFQRLFESRGMDFRVLSRAELDYTDPALLDAALKDGRPDFLINAAGYTGKPNVEACENAKDECLLGNAVLPARIAQVCAERGVPWGHVSSGCIYTGSREDGTPFTEEDEPNFTFEHNNCSYYSGTKAMGEQALQDYDATIWRLRIPFDHRHGPRNYLSKLMHYEKLVDAPNSISHLDEFAKAALACWERGVEPGIYNVTNPGQVTTREVVELIRESGVCDREFEFFESEEEFMRTTAKTPRSNCIMSSDKLARAGIALTPVREALQKALANWQDGDA